MNAAWRFKTKSNECFLRLRLLALDGLSLVAQGWAPAPGPRSALDARQYERKPAGVWALAPGIGVYNRPYLMLTEMKAQPAATSFLLWFCQDCLNLLAKPKTPSCMPHMLTCPLYKLQVEARGKQYFL